LSGFVGILNLDGAPVERHLLERMTEFLAFRGPDAQEIWCQGELGLGFALLRVACEAEDQRQPAALENRLWIVADARVDARAELVSKLDPRIAHGREVSAATPDAELILRAYERWDDRCLDHLLGDFSFAIWDAARKRLFCARDQMGVKPFFYARAGNALIFSNTLEAIRLHPDVSGRLNDLAIADFLIFDMNQDPATTSFADIQRLPPAHMLECDSGKLSTRRYWMLPVTTPVRYQRDLEYVEHFLELLDAAVADRLRTGSAGVLMSGGLDSPTVAASARRVFTRYGDGTCLRAYTEVFEKLIPHEERHYATLVAEALDIPIEFLVGDHWRLFERADQPEYRSSQPVHLAWPDSTVDQLRMVSLRSRVALTGYGADPGLSCLLSVHFRKLLKARQFGRAFTDALRYLSTEGRLSRLYLRTRWRRWFAPKSLAPSYPGWLNEDLEKRCKLRDRWGTLTRPEPFPDAVRPEAHSVTVAPFWPYMFEGFDAGSTRVPVEVLYPFFDLRVMNFLLGLPRLPWCSDKQILREAARDVLPHAVRVRKKSPLPGEPLLALLQRPDSAWVDAFEPVSELGQYVMRDRIPPVYQEKDSWAAWIHLRPLSLNFWLRGQRSIR
jgi:asparagine synthase (glutamine-hydrolysing)